MSKDVKNVPALRFKGYSDAWEKRKLGETNSYFTDGNYGESYPKESELSDKENGVPFLRGSNLRNGELIEDNANYITKEKHAELTSGHLVEDDIVLAVRGSLGALGYVKEENIDWNINSQLAVIRTDKSELSGKFLAQFLLSWRGQKELLSRNTGTALKQLPIKQLKDVPVPIVNLDEQKEISALFTSIDNLIAATQDKIDALEQAKRALLQRLFDQSWRFKGYSDPWEKRKLREVSDVRDGTHASPKYYSQGYPLVTSKNLTSAGLDFSNISLISELDYKNINKRSRVDKGDILFGMIGTIGTPVMVHESNFAIKNVALIKEREAVLNSFLVQLLKSPAFINYIRNENVGGTQKFLSLNTIRNFRFSFPTSKEQAMVSRFLEKIDSLIAATQSRLSSLELLKKALLQDLFI